LNPHGSDAARFSKPARQTVFGYLPYVLPSQWSAGESNPDFLGANQASSRWTSVPWSSCEPWAMSFGPRDAQSIWLIAHRSKPTASSSSRGGSRTRKRQALDLTAFPICVPDRSYKRETVASAESNRSAGLMKPSGAPAHSQ
jgi:hypothetical protein